MGKPAGAVHGAQAGGLQAAFGGQEDEAVIGAQAAGCARRRNYDRARGDGKRPIVNSHHA